MRDIKFRFYSKASERYVSDNDNYAVCGNGDIYHLPDAYYDKFEPVSGDYVIKEQYTGLKDKNGVEIYEGDVFFDGIENCTIEWCDESASFVANDGTEKHALGEWTNHEEVIGNIHQNQKLLGN